MADGEKRIKELEEITALTSNDYFVVDSSASGGKTKKYKATYITDIINNIPELVAEFEPNHYYDRDALVAHEGKVYYHNAPGASYEEFPTGYQFIQIDLTGLLSRLGFGISIQHNSSFTYNKGDYCMEDYILYRCLNDNVTGAWSSSDWERASLGYDLSSIYKPRLDEHDEQIEEALVLGTASGSIASFTDGSTLPMKKLEVDIEPVQDLHGYDNPWVGGSGKNKFDQDSITEISSTAENRRNGQVFEGVGTFTVSASSNISGGNVIYSRLYSNGSYGAVTAIATDNSHTSQTYTLASGDKIIIFDALQHTIADSKILFAQAKVQLESGNQATSYAPYSNICPISGWDECNVTRHGQNILDESNLTNNYIDTDGSLVSNSSYRTTDYLDFSNISSFRYGVSRSVTGGWLWRIACYNASKTFISMPVNRTLGAGDWTGEVTLPDNTKYVRVCFVSDTYNRFFYDNVTYNTYTIDLDGTRYGGKLDVVSGTLVVDRVKTSMPANWTVNTESSTYWLITNTRSDAISVENTDTSIRVISDGFKGISANEMLTKMTTADNINSIALISSKRLFLKVAKADYPTLNDLYSMIQTNNLQTVYELATPQTIQLTPTEVKSLLATNNVFADTGDILDATYVRNANITINDLIRRIEALES